MCNARPEVVTYHWGGPNGLMSGRRKPRECTNWDALASWVDERAIVVDDWEAFLATLAPEPEDKRTVSA